MKTKKVIIRTTSMDRLKTYTLEVEEGEEFIIRHSESVEGIIVLKRIEERGVFALVLSDEDIEE